MCRSIYLILTICKIAAKLLPYLSQNILGGLMSSSVFEGLTLYPDPLHSKELYHSWDD